MARAGSVILNALDTSGLGAFSENTLSRPCGVGSDWVRSLFSIWTSGDLDTCLARWKVTCPPVVRDHQRCVEIAEAERQEVANLHEEIARLKMRETQLVAALARIVGFVPNISPAMPDDELIGWCEDDHAGFFTLGDARASHEALAATPDATKQVVEDVRYLVDPSSIIFSPHWEAVMGRLRAGFPALAEVRGGG